MRPCAKPSICPRRVKRLWWHGPLSSPPVKVTRGGLVRRTLPQTRSPFPALPCPALPSLSLQKPRDPSSPSLSRPHAPRSSYAPARGGADAEADRTSGPSPSPSPTQEGGGVIRAYGGGGPGGSPSKSLVYVEERGGEKGKGKIYVLSTIRKFCFYYLLFFILLTVFFFSMGFYFGFLGFFLQKVGGGGGGERQRGVPFNI